VTERTAQLRQANADLATKLGERKAAEAALRQHDALLKAVTRGAGELLGSHSFEDAAPIVLELIGQSVAVSHVQLSAITPDARGHLRSHVVHEWGAPGAAAPAQNPALQEFDLTAQLPQVVAPLLAGTPIAFFAEDIAEPFRARFAAALMHSLLMMPVQVDGKLWGSFTFIDCGEARRLWSWAETDTLQTLGDLIGVAITRAGYVQQLADANMIVQNSPTILYRLAGEPSFPLIYVSHNITKFGHDPAKLVGTADWAERLVHPDDREKLNAAMGRALEKEAQAASIEFRLLTGDGSFRWVDNRYTPVRDKSGRLCEVEGIIIDITERRAAEEKIALLARTDPLTGLANRATLIERLHQAFAATRRGAGAFAILFLDLDHFKNINDTLGHPVGDLLLREAASRLQNSVRETDVVARLGGDEFAILQADMGEPANAGVLAAKIRSTLSAPYLIEGNELHLTTSIGISPFMPGTAGPDAMLAQADLALYRAKDEGRDRYCFHSRELDEQMRMRTTLSEDLRRALERDDELALYYQPQVELSSGRIVGMEALVRWNHPARGLLYPADFIPVAEKTGSVTALGAWVFERACSQLKAWQADGVAPPVVAVNLSLSELKTGRELVRNVTAVIKKWGLSASQIEFDVTEATLAQLTWTQNDVLEQLHQLGCRIAIDDFGAEYSSFNYLRAYAVNHVKIAQPFIRRAAEDPSRAATIRAIITLARELGIEVIAEGVETRDQRDLLMAIGSTAAQGFYFSAAVDAGRAGELLSRGNVRPPNASTSALEPAQKQ
jgi:diguanylate cyclase (GGDEF)-like protein/PAS domain S-box-containing protein